MTTAIADRPTTAALSVTSEQLELVRKTVASGATDAELKLYLYDCARHGVHPLDRLLHFTKRGGKYTPITSIDLMRIRAADTGECVGISDPVFEGGVSNAPISATVTVQRLVAGSHVGHFTATARWSEYFPGDAQGHMWKKMPHTMLGKCAEALALRKGFPQQLAGLYAREEMEQADSSQPAAVTVVPPTVQSATGEAINAVTGEVVPEDGQLRILRVEARPTQTGKDRWYVCLSNGIEACTFKQQESALAEQLCQEQAVVEAETKDGGKWGYDLKSLKRALTNADLDREIAAREPAQEGAPF